MKCHRPHHTPKAWPLLVVALFLHTGATAQNEEDALRISSYQIGGTGRSTGLANAFGALGADGAAIGINPAGMGLYRVTELSITPSLEVNTAKSTYYGTTATDTRTNFHINNFTLAIHNPSEKNGPWRSSTYGIAFDRQASYQWESRALGTSIPSTILQAFVNEADGTRSGDLSTQFPFSAGLAWDTYGIDPLDTVANTYISAIPFGSLTSQEQITQSKGASSNTSFFYSGSYMDKIYLGASVGFTNHRFERTRTHTETTLDESLDLQELTYTEELNTTGTGIDLKIGIIARLSDRFRMGAAYHSAKGMDMTDAFFYGMATYFRTPDALGRTIYAADSPDGLFTYKVRSPWRLALSAAYVAGQNGLVSVDYGYTDPRKMEMRPQEPGAYDFQAENLIIASSFRPVHSIRAGTEWRHGAWYYRVGWGFVGDPYKESDPRHGQAQRTYAGGVGYRTDHIGIDLGLNMVTSSRSYFQYDPELVDATTEQRNSFRTMLTVSLRP
jgi:hypothetical protein